MENKLNIRQFFILFSYGKFGKWAFSCSFDFSLWDLKRVRKDKNFSETESFDFSLWDLKPALIDEIVPYPRVLTFPFGI